MPMTLCHAGTCAHPDKSRLRREIRSLTAYQRGIVAIFQRDIDKLRPHSWNAGVAAKLERTILNLVRYVDCCLSVNEASQ